MDYPKSVPNVGLVSGKFVDENTSTGQVGSLIPATWGSAVTDEILNVIMSGGVAPEENQNDQLLLAIKEIIKDNIPPEKIRTTLAEYGITDAYTKTKVYTKDEINELLKNATALPVGAMVPFPVGVVPPGYLEVDNRLFKDDVYPDLAAYLAKKFNLAGDAADYTRLPESRGEFFRGWDHGRGVDAGRALGSSQLSQNLRHVHAEVVTSSVIADQAQFVAGSKLPAPTMTQILYNDTNATDNYTALPADHAASGGAEARPRNLAVMWCIKAWNAPINQGNIDIAALSMLVAQATESSQGTAKVGTQLQVDEGTSDSTIVTPKKMRFGFQFIKGVNGAIVFPTWLGGFIFQWGLASDVPRAGSGIGPTRDVTLPTVFPTAALSTWASYAFNNMTSGSAFSPGAAFLSNSVIRVQNNYTSSAGEIRWYAIGY